MKHTDYNEDKYEVSLEKELKGILDDFSQNNYIYDTDLSQRTAAYIAMVEKNAPDDIDGIIHKLRLITKFSNYSWDLNNLYKQLLEQKLIDAHNKNDKERIQDTLKEYIELFKIDPPGTFLDEELINFFVDLEDNEAINNKIKESVKNNKLALVIGAGITAKYVGDWNKLLNNLMTLRIHSRLLLDNEADNTIGITFEEIEKYLNEHVKSFIGENVNYLERGEYLRFDSNDNSVLIDTVNEDLYRELYFAEQVKYIITRALNNTHGQNFIERFKSEMKKAESMSTLSALLKLCIKQNIKEIITYNFDTVFERLLADEEVQQHFGGGSRKQIRVEVYSNYDRSPVLILPAESARGGDRTVKIYHVHGILDEAVYPVSPVIFSETSYQNYQDTILNWANFHLKEMQAQYDILCVGFSGDDPNFRAQRRLFLKEFSNPAFYNSAKGNYIFLLRNYKDVQFKLLDSVDLDKDNNKEISKAIIKTYFDMVISYFKKQYSIDIIWSYGFDHMAAQINELADL